MNALCWLVCFDFGNSEVSEIPKSRKIRNFGNFELVVEIAIFSWNHNLPDSPALRLSDSRENCAGTCLGGISEIPRRTN